MSLLYSKITHSTHLQFHLRTSSMNLHSYHPQDRPRALARSESLPDRTTGSALFADISGFTALTEGLRESLGARQGAEELTKHLSTVYTALIAEIEKYGGSVIGRGEYRWAFVPRRVADGLLSRIGWNESRAI